jgi:hypothetical protein
MLYIKRAWRLLIISLFVICASFGIGIFGTNFRENFMNRKKNAIELVEKKEDEDDDEG